MEGATRGPGRPRRRHRGRRGRVSLRLAEHGTGDGCFAWTPRTPGVSGSSPAIAPPSRTSTASWPRCRRARHTQRAPPVHRRRRPGHRPRGLSRGARGPRHPVERPLPAPAHRFSFCGDGATEPPLTDAYGHAAAVRHDDRRTAERGTRRHAECAAAGVRLERRHAGIPNLRRSSDPFRVRRQIAAAARITVRRRFACSQGRQQGGAVGAVWHPTRCHAGRAEDRPTKGQTWPDTPAPTEATPVATFPSRTPPGHPGAARTMSRAGSGADLPDVESR